MRSGCVGCAWAHSFYPALISVVNLPLELMLYRVAIVGCVRAGCDRGGLYPLWLCYCWAGWATMSVLSCSYHCIRDTEHSMHVCRLLPSLSRQWQCYIGERTEHGAPPSLLDEVLQGIRGNVVRRSGIAMKMNGACNSHKKEGRQNFLWIIPQDTRGLRRYSHNNVVGTRVPISQFWQNYFQSILHVA